jgi:hypothetical protein
MRPQARPFSVEIKSRKRSTPPATASAARDDWIDALPPDDVPARDVRADLADPGQSEARRKAESVFARLNGRAAPSETQEEAEEPIAPAPEASAPRVLPDLLAGAREEERKMVEKPKRTPVPKPTKVERLRKTKSPGPRLEQPERAASEPATKITPLPTGDAQAAMSQSRRAKQRASKLPPGQRWKERRLPRVCWDR